MTTETKTPAPQDTPKGTVDEKLYPDATKTPDAVTPPVEAKPEDKKPVDEVKPVDEKPAVPAKYELKLPENSPLSAAQVEAVSSYAKEKGLTNDQAQSILEERSTAVASYLTDQTQQFDAQVQKWKEAVQADPELGGANFTQSAHLSKQVAEKFGGAEFIKELDDTGFGNHPGLVRLLVRVGKAMDNDTLIRPGSANSNQARSPADILYPRPKN